jgi:hypothetical protein
MLVLPRERNECHSLAALEYREPLIRLIGLVDEPPIQVRVVALDSDADVPGKCWP